MPKAKDSGFKDQTNEERKSEKLLKELEGKQYREFGDEPIKSPLGGSKEYYGDGKAQTDFFTKNSNVNEILASMSNQEKNAFDMFWTVGHFMYGQQWGGFGSMDKFDQGLTRIYDKVLDKSVLSQGVVVNRLTSAELLLGKGHKTATLAELKALYGQPIIARANMSCGVASKGLHIGDLNKNVELKIHIPAGSKGAGMWLGDKSVNSTWDVKQREFITNRDTAYMVGKTTSRVDHNGKTVYVVHMYYLGNEKHQY